ncbi:MAG: hypothetical protein AAGH15_24325 [Myxococcota bacterium]
MRAVPLPGLQLQREQDSMLVSRRVGDCVALVHARGVPDDEAFGRALDELGRGAAVFLPFTYADATLRPQQRRELASTLARHRVRVAAIVESDLQRRMAVAVGWFVPGLRVFSTAAEELEEAYAFAIPGGGGPLREAILDLHRVADVRAPLRLPV